MKENRAQGVNQPFARSETDEAHLSYSGGNLHEYYASRYACEMRYMTRKKNRITL